jgi:hypothetical protein
MVQASVAQASVAQASMAQAQASVAVWRGLYETAGVQASVAVGCGLS